MKKVILSLGSIGIATSLFCGDFNVIKLDEARKLFENKSALFLDARSPKLYQSGTIMGALNLEKKDYQSQKVFLPADKKLQIVSFCNGVKCEHSDHLAEALIKDGYKNVLVYRGGYPEWKENKLPTMGKQNECKNESVNYIPKRAATNIKGATVHLVDGDDSMIDQFWFAKIVLDKLPTNLQLVDVRGAEQYAEGHVKGAINVPFIDDKIDTSKLSKDKLNVFYCNTGMKSSEAIQTIKDSDIRVIYFDANVKCTGENCTVSPNDLL